jgi:hypothetical protein
VGARVLVVEDAEAIRAAVLAGLTGAGFDAVAPTAARWSATWRPSAPTWSSST